MTFRTLLDAGHYVVKLYLASFLLARQHGKGGFKGDLGGLGGLGGVFGGGRETHAVGHFQGQQGGTLALSSYC